MRCPKDWHLPVDKRHKIWYHELGILMYDEHRNGKETIQ